MTAFTRDITIGGDTFTEFEVEALFDIETETGTAEPYSWGGSRGSELCAVSWEIVHINMNGFKIGRTALIDMLGKDEVIAIENSACEAFLEAA